MGILDDILGGGVGEKVDYWACKIPYFIDDSWPLVGAPKVYSWMDDNMIKMSGTCGIAGWYIRQWGDKPKGSGVVYTGDYYKNEKTGEEIWTVHAWHDKQGLMDAAGDNIALKDPPVGAPTSPFLGDPDVPSAGPPPGVELGPVIADPTTPGGGYQTVVKNKVAPEFKQAGMMGGIPWWGWLAGLGIIGGIAYAAKKRKKKKGKKSRLPWERP